MDRIRYITHRGQQVLFADLTDCAAEELQALVDHVPELVTKEPAESVLILGDFSRAQFNKETVEHLKIATVFDKSHIKRAAWVLTENLPKALYDSIVTFSRRKIPIFATREEALDYLVGE